MLIATVNAPKILEIGCGSGDSISRILTENRNLNPGSITGTSLTELSEHTQIRKLGVNIKTGIMAEELPNNWSDTFDLVMACMVMSHTVLYESVPQILKVLTPGGHFIGYDNRLIVSTIEDEADKHQASVLQIQQFPFYSEIQPFAFQKKSIA